MDLVPLLDVLKQASIYLIAFSLGLARMTGVMIIAPVFNRLGVTGAIRAGVGLALAIPLAPMISEVVSSQPFTIGGLAVFLFKEIFAGLLIGLVMGIPFWAAETAGAILDLQRGSSMATLVDPSGSDETSILGTLFIMASLAIFYGSGGLDLLIGAIYDSYGVWPVGHLLPVLSREAGVLFLMLLDKVFTMGLMLAAPLVIALLLSDLVLALVSRAAPNLHVFDLSLSVKSLVLSILIVLYSPFMFDYMAKDLAALTVSQKQFELISGAPKTGP